jgi:hypothetical protein
MRPITRMVILIVLIIGLYEFFSLILGNDALHKTAIVQAYTVAVRLAHRNEEEQTLAQALGNSVHNILPTSEELEGTAIRRLSYEQGGAIHIELDARSGVDGGVLVYLPLVRNGKIAEWACVTHDYPTIESFLPACRYME